MNYGTVQSDIDRSKKKRRNSHFLNEKMDEIIAKYKDEMKWRKRLIDKLREQPHYIDVNLKCFSHTHTHTLTQFYVKTIFQIAIHWMHNAIVTQRVQSFFLQRHFSVSVSVFFFSPQKKKMSFHKSIYLKNTFICWMIFCTCVLLNYLYPLHYTVCLCSWFISWDSCEQFETTWLWFSSKRCSFAYFRMNEKHSLTRYIRFDCTVSSENCPVECSQTEILCANLVQVEVNNLSMFYGE